MAIFPGSAISSGGYNIENSLRFNSADSTYLSWTPASQGNRQKWTLSLWVKRSTLSTNDAGIFSADATFELINFPAEDGFQVYINNGSANLSTNHSSPSIVFRDPSAWYHLIIAWDTAQQITTERVKLYVNGAQIRPEELTNHIYPDQYAESGINNDVEHSIGRRVNSAGLYFNGYMAEVNFIDGQALDPADFGEVDASYGHWIPKEYTGTYGDNGFYLPFKPTGQASGMNTVLYEGNGSTQSINGFGFNPDLVWIKNRDSAYNHILSDSVRGAGTYLSSSTTDADASYGNVVTAFNSNGFDIGSIAGGNNSGNKIVAWGWDAGDNQTATGHSSILYKGSGGAISLKGFGFSPDLVWIKNRDGTAQNQMLFDSVRGANLRIQPDATSTEYNQTGSLTSFDSDGFTLGTSTTNINATSSNYVAWGWDAGDGDPVTNTDGDITSTVKASDATGFSIVTYTGNGSSNQTIGHGLSSAPKVIIVKNRTTATGWLVYHASAGNTGGLILDLPNATVTSSTYWNDTTPTSSVFTVGTSNAVNQNTNSLVAYCFSEVSGVSKFGSYTGNGSSSGPTVTTGFRPGFLMIKRRDASGSWLMVDGTRNPFNPVDASLYADDFANEGAANRVNFTDTGFEVIDTNTLTNGNGEEYVYMAFKGSYSDYVSPLNDTGTIDSRVKANPDKGFSIVSYEGSGSNGTLGHGLSSAPEMVIVKRRDSTGDWVVWNETIAASSSSNVLFLNGTDAQSSYSTNFNSTAPTSSVFTVGTNPATNASGGTHIAYCFHSVAGYSDIGSYTGNGSTTGPVVTTGFRPAFVLLKASTRATGWIMVDNTRDPDNFASEYLYADTDSAEATYTNILEFTDTGFELRIAGGASNVNGDTYIYMAFADTRDYQWNHDASGNLNNWTPNNINSNAPSESNYALMTDVPTLTDEDTANFCTWNPISSTVGSTTNGNLQANNTGVANWHSKGGTIAVNSGKWYWEVYVNAVGTYTQVGIGADSEFWGSTVYPGQSGYAYQSNASKHSGGSNQGSYGATFTTGDLIGVALDLDAGTLVFYKNGTSQGTAFTGITGAYLPAVGTYGTGSTILNAGQRPFAYTPPTGFKKLNTYNLPDPAVKPQKNFSAVNYSGNGTAIGSGGLTVSGVGFQPDFVWGKRRDTAAYHGLVDSTRGGTKLLFSNSTDAETTYSEGISSFNADGFTVGNLGNFNALNGTFVAWNWLADNTSGSANENGVISSTVAANPDAGFSIVKYTGTGSATTVGHGLSSAPEMVIIKNRDLAARDWSVWHTGINGNQYLSLNATYAATTDTTVFTGTTPTSTVFTIGTFDGLNGSGDEHIAYCFHSVDGYSKFGSYTGNGSADGPFIHTGFRPAYVMVKRTDVSSHSWLVYDSVRDAYNDVGNLLYADTTTAENPLTDRFDFISNGFKLRTDNASHNASGGTYIYAAFAEYPFKYTNARGTSFDKYSDPTQSALTIGQSARFSGTYTSAPAYLSRSVSVTGNRKTWTYSTWIKIAESAQLYPDTMPIFSTGSSSSYHIQCRLVSGYQIQVYATWGGSDAISVATGDNTKLRDFAGWYHLVVSYDTTQPTAANRVKLFLNGSLLTDLSQTTYPSQNAEYSMNYNPIYVGGYLTFGSYADHYQAETNLIDGQALGPESFGYRDTTTGQWLPRSYNDFNTEVDYGQNGFRLDYQSGAIGTDRSGNNNDLTATGMSSTNDVTLDSPSNNFCVFNPLEPTYAKFSEGDLTISSMTATNSKAVGTIYVDIEDSEGYYFEVRIGTNGTTHGSTGISKRENVNIPYSSTLGAVSITASGSVYLNGTLEVSGLTTFSVGDIISIYFKSGNLYYAINGTAVNSGNPVLTGLTGYWTGAAWRASSTASPSYIFNFGQDSSFASAETRQNNQDSNSIGDFQFTVPTGFKAICTSNLPASTITNGRDYFNTVLYSGDGTNDREITGVGFQPDFTWLKARNDLADHTLFDAVRGAGSDKALYSNGTYAEGAYTAGFDAFLSDGFQVDNNVYTNNSSNTYAAWNWKANGSGVSNSEGDITVTVSADTTSGFSIVKGTYTGVSSSQTFGHGLSATPAMIITKDIDTTANFGIWHQAYGVTSGNTPIMIFNTNGVFSAGNYMGTVSSTLSSVSSGLIVNGNDFVQYIWTEVEGFSKFGSYTGNGSTDGPFVYTGFKPAWILLKESSASTEHWFIYDSARDEYNLTEARLMPNLANAEDNVVDMGDFVSNGFKIRPTGSYINQFNRSSATIIYAAFAENPFKNSNAR